MDNCAALFALNYWLRECPLSSFTDHSELRGHPKATDAVVFRYLSLLIQLIMTQPNKDRFCNTKATVALTDTSVQSDK